MDPVQMTLAVLAFATVMFVWEKIPMALTSVIICLLLALSGVLDARSAFSGFINPNVILFVAMFVVGGALFETGMAGRLGGLVTRFARTERQMIVAIMMIVGLLSAVLSNTGTAAVMIPVVIGIAERTGFSRSRLLMPLAFASTMGGTLTLIGSPGNLIAQHALQQSGQGFGFFEYGKIGLPMLLCGTAFFALFGTRLLPAEPRTAALDDETPMVSVPVRVPAWKPHAALLILLATIIGMIFEPQIGIPLHVIACIGAVVTVLTGVLSEGQAYRAIDTRTIFIFGGTLSLADALEKTGAGTLVATRIIEMLGQDPSPFLLLVAVFGLSCALTNFMSNTATIALLVPVGLSIAEGMGADPRAVLIAIVIGGSCGYATPICMPPNVMVLVPGGYRFVDYMRAGIPLILLSGLVSIPLLLWLFPLFP